MSKSSGFDGAKGEIQRIFRSENSGFWEKALFAGRIKMKREGRN
jgi:hypothetical protein